MLAVAEKPAAAYSESALVTLWSRAHTLADGLVTEDGHRLQVVYPGRRSALAGPDFRDAVLLDESGKTLTGDVEIHITAPGWYSHAHHTDANYNGVVLHIVFSPKGHRSSRQRSGANAPVAALAAVAANLERAPPDAVPDLPSLRMPKDAARIGDTLDAAGDARFLSKSRGFAADIDALGADETLYRGLMDALGYATNRKPFRILAARVPYHRLAALRGEPPATRLLAIKAALLGASGLMASAASLEDIAQLRRIHRRIDLAKPIDKREWKLFRVRPSNHPARRILGAALIIDGCIDRGIAKAFADALLDGGRRALTARLEAKPYVGGTRARDMLVNIALPFLHSYATTGGIAERGRNGLPHGCADLAAAALDAYATAPKLQENEITREMRRLCGIDGKTRLNARRQQGLLELYRRAVRGDAYTSGG